MSRQLDIRAVIATHNLYESMVPQGPQLDFNGAWVIARDLRVGTAELPGALSGLQRQPPGADLPLRPARPTGRTLRAPLILPTGIAESPGDGDRAILLTPSEEDP